MHEKTLELIGLTEEQAVVYETLVEHGPLKAGEVTKKTPIKRSLVYYTLKRLLDIGLIEKDEAGKVIKFRARHPAALKDLAEREEKRTQSGRVVLESILPDLVSKFSLVSGMPGVRFFEGVQGFRKIYDDILETGRDIYLIRSVYEPVYQHKVKPIVHDFVEARKKKGLRATALTPPRPSGMPEKTESEDKVDLYSRTRLRADEYTAPVEIDIYGDNVALMSFGEELIGITIESPQIAKAVKEIFLLAKKGAERRI